MNRRSWLTLTVLAGLTCGPGNAQDSCRTANATNVDDTLLSDANDLVLLAAEARGPLGDSLTGQAGTAVRPAGIAVSP